MRPMLATPSATPGSPPAGAEWVHEVKWDGVRIVAQTDGTGVQLFNRTEGEVSLAYPELTRAGAVLPPGLVVDAEVVAFDARGLPSFSAIGHRMHVRSARRAQELTVTHPVTLMVFDVVQLADRDLMGEPWWRRREVLEGLDLPGLTAGAWQVPDTHDDGAALAHATRQQGLEGVVSKRRGSPYRPGARSTDWVKVPHRRELVGVIGGWIPQVDSPGRLGGLFLGHPADEASFPADGIMYPLARAGSGLSHAERAGLLTVLRTIEQPHCPFDPRPSHPDVRRARWVEPAICVQLRHLGGATEAGVLRQPVLRAIRPEITPLQAPYAELLTLPG